MGAVRGDVTDRPSGAVTFVFTDIEGSARRLLLVVLDNCAHVLDAAAELTAGPWSVGESLVGCGRAIMSSIVGAATIDASCADRYCCSDWPGSSARRTSSSCTASGTSWI